MIDAEEERGESELSEVDNKPAKKTHIEWLGFLAWGKQPAGRTRKNQKRSRRNRSERKIVSMLTGTKMRSGREDGKKQEKLN